MRIMESGCSRNKAQSAQIGIPTETEPLSPTVMTNTSGRVLTILWVTMVRKRLSSRSPYTIKKCTPTTSKSSANLLCLCKTNNSRKRYLRANSSLSPISVFRPLYAARSKSHHRHVLSVCNRQWTLKANHLDPNPTSQLARWRGFGCPNISFRPLLLTTRKLAFTTRR